MKWHDSTVAFATALGLAALQRSLALAAPDPMVTVTSFVDACSTLPVEMILSTITVEECELCAENAAAASAHPAVGGTTTIYEMTCSDVGPAGPTMVTYTVTEPCTATGQALPSDHVPQGYAVVTKACTVCEGESMVVTTPVSTPTAAPAGEKMPAMTPPVPASAPAAGGAPPPASAPGAAMGIYAAPNATIATGASCETCAAETSAVIIQHASAPALALSTMTFLFAAGAAALFLL